MQYDYLEICNCILLTFKPIDFFDFFNMSDTPRIQWSESSEDTVQKEMLSDLIEAHDMEESHMLFFHVYDSTYQTFADPKEWSFSELESLKGEELLFLNRDQLLPLVFQSDEVKLNLKLHKQWQIEYEAHSEMMKSNNIKSLIWKFRTKLAKWIKPSF